MAPLFAAGGAPRLEAWNACNLACTSFGNPPVPLPTDCMDAKGTCEGPGLRAAFSGPSGFGLCVVVWESDIERKEGRVRWGWDGGEVVVNIDAESPKGSGEEGVSGSSSNGDDMVGLKSGDEKWGRRKGILLMPATTVVVYSLVPSLLSLKRDIVVILAQEPQPSFKHKK